jgi:heme/copper-type cytochrome/quinol oxidase subunit 1
MKKIENWLVLPLILLLFYGASKHSSTTTTDVHFHDTYYVIANRIVAGCCLIWLAIVYVLFKNIRRRHQSIDRRYAIPYLVLTLFIFLAFWLPTGVETGMNGISDAQLDKWLFYNQLRILSVYIFVFAQVSFLIYYIVQMVRKPHSTNSNGKL